MIKHMRLFTPIALLLVLAVVVSGCAAGQQVTAADVVAKMRETMKNTQSSQGTVDLALTINKEGLKTLAESVMGGKAGDMGDTDWASKLPDSASATLNVWQQSHEKARVEVASSTLPGVKGAILVYDGQKVYAYDPVHNTVYTATPDEMLDKAPAELKAILANMQDPEKTLDKLLDAADVKLSGTEKVADLDAYKLDITPKPDAAQKLDLPAIIQSQAGLIIKDLHATVWVDKDRWIPLKLTLEHPNMGTFTYTATKIELNKPIDPSKFVLQTPPGAKTVDLDAISDKMAPKSTTLAEARAQATKDGWKLLEPQYVPDNATLIEVLRAPGRADNLTSDVNGFVLNYSSPTTNFSVIEGKSADEGLLDKGLLGDKLPGAVKDVQVRGVTAKAFSPAGGNFTVLFWQEKDNGIWAAIHGKLSLDEAVKVAEGLK